ncbi:MAG: hypothetical protein A3I29_01730 [Candidatus Magasanikbacteria bacterium RIFCSPLOWO2_02_FULL_44_11]|uniref:DUF5655 domain-containing protein n=1 Tax=Candidatus Magasanikbacteria bacterium RIFCSPLOWO2_02_FULL_44_11 TaxID=1798689 RepID=A0A1F6NBE5_9BACT|nr:MAG: hypothetical protein A3I29_01730 [Candidatus Magasanikbacteria bacterium RIFCSPLOWO2_02_FULL_44_11]OGQ02937.1 MAG: hypothetical protein A3D19_05865 [Deltaproteobacteria bacterium RIFCSPHIGHO2_02_FULL_38_15]
MPIFKIEGQILASVKELQIDLEKDMQNLTETNLELVFDLKFISSEFSLHNFRIDTLAFDDENNSFVIIEYKRDRSFSIIDQGYAYLSLMLNNKADFILEYNERTGKSLKREDVDWSQSRVLFLANSFTAYQQNAINFKDLPIELWEVKKFSNDLVLFNQLKSPETSESIKTVSKNKTIENVGKEIKKYTIDDLIKNDWHNSRNIFDNIQERILNLDSRVVIKINQNYIAFKIGTNNLCAIHVYKSKLDLELLRVEKKDIKDPENKVFDTPWEERGYGRFCATTITTTDDIDYALFLVKQVHEKFFK